MTRAGLPATLDVDKAAADDGISSGSAAAFASAVEAPRQRRGGSGCEYPGTANEPG
jgi:hypothetical protein